jgi:hypothetical protein
VFKLPTFVYNKDMDQLVLMNNIVDSEEEEPCSPTCLGEGMTKRNDEKETMPTATKCSRNEIVDINEEAETMP